MLACKPLTERNPIGISRCRRNYRGNPCFTITTVLNPSPASTPADPHDDGEAAAR
jgi:hypothetical protein